MFSLIWWLVIMLTAAAIVAGVILLSLWLSGHILNIKRASQDPLTAVDPEQTLETRRPLGTKVTTSSPTVQWTPFQLKTNVPCPDDTTNLSISSEGTYLAACREGESNIVMYQKTADHGYEQHHVVNLLTDSTDQLSISEQGQVATIDEETGNVLVAGITEPLVIPAFRAHRLSWAGQKLWIAALDANESGQIFSWQQGQTQAEPMISPIRGSRNQDYFGFHFHVNGTYALVAHPLDRTAHLFQQDENRYVAVTILDPHVEASLFPYSVAVAADGSWVLLGNPTSNNETGSVVFATRKTLTDYSYQEFQAAHAPLRDTWGRTVRANQDSQFIHIGGNTEHEIYDRNFQLQQRYQSNSKAYIGSMDAKDLHMITLSPEGGQIDVLSASIEA